MFNHQSSLKQFDTIVIGSGISGLTTSLILAKEGKKVALFERDDDIAPLIRPYQRKGCQCSPGLHFCGWMDKGEIIADFLGYLSVADGVEKVIYDQEFLNIFAGSHRYFIAKGFQNVKNDLISFFPESSKAIDQYLNLVKEVNDQTFYFNKDLSPNLSINHDFRAPANATLEECLHYFQASRGLINLLETINYVIIGSKANEVPFTTHAFAIGGFYQSPGYFTINGINRLLSNFKRELQHYGVKLFLRTEVETILIGQDKNVTGVRTVSGEDYSAERVVASFNPKLLNAMIRPGALRPIYKQRLDEAEDTFGFYAAFYQVDNGIDLELQNFILYDQSLDSHIILTTNVSGENRVLCIFLADNSQAVADDSNQRNDRAKAKLEYMENVVFQKFPTLKGNTVLLDYCKPWSFERYTKTYHGSAYGIKQTINSMSLQQKVPIHGLYLVGQAIFPGFLGSMISGFSLACELFGVDQFWPRVIKR